MSERAKIVIIYSVHDGDDERSSGQPTWHFLSEDQAKSVARGRGWYGGDSPISKQAAIIFGDDAYLLARETPIKIGCAPVDELAKKQAVLAKLTEHERKILGFK